MLMGPWLRRMVFACLLLLLGAPAVFAQASKNDANAAVGMAAGTIIVIFVCAGLAIVLSLCITAYICYFMYTDANSRGENGVLWAVIGFFGGLLGLIVWLIIRPEKKKRSRG